MEIDTQHAREFGKELAAKGVEYCFATYVDIHGVPKAKTVPVEYFTKMAKGSELFTVGAMEGMGLVGPHEDECAAVPDLDSCIIFPWDKRFAWFASDLYYHGEPYVNDSRTILKRAARRARERGYIMYLGIECEFYVLRKTEQGLKILQENGYKGICPAYDVYQTTQSMGFLDPMVKHMGELDWGVYSFDQEGGHGQYELDFAYADALTMADRFVFFRFMAKTVAQQLGCIATFMPKPFPNDFRNGAHHNFSLHDVASGDNLFAGRDAAAAHHQGFSRLALHFAGGLLAHAPAVTAVACPTYNSYQGLLAQGDMPDTSWAPLIRCYGNNNRSAMLRLPMSRPCIENRAADMAMNPYLSADVHLAAGLDGIVNKTDPGEPRNENLYSTGAELELLPRTLLDALRGFDADPLAAQVFGPEMKDIFIRHKTREWERHFYQVSPRQIDDMLTFV